MDAFRWSRDSSKIAFWRLDQTKVKSYMIYDETSNSYPTISNLKYPKVGEDNSVVTIGIVDVANGNTEFIDFKDVSIITYFKLPYFAKDFLFLAFDHFLMLTIRITNFIFLVSIGLLQIQF